jgi:hypothetical protein
MPVPGSKALCPPLKQQITAMSGLSVTSSILVITPATRDRHMRAEVSMENRTRKASKCRHTTLTERRQSNLLQVSGNLMASRALFQV